jgi:cytochrome c-type biogenesis protein CcmF
MKTSKEVHFTRGESATVAGYTLTFLGAEEKPEPHRHSTIAHFDVSKNGKHVTTMNPRMNQYERMREPIGTPDVHTTLIEDLYLSAMNIDSASNTVALNVIVTPMVAWVWISVLLMGLGGLIALIPHRRAVTPAAQVPARVEGALEPREA